MDEERLLGLLTELRYPNVGQIASAHAILSPGKLRYQLLEWLFEKYDSSLLDSSKARSNGSEDESDTARALRLASLAALLGLCPPNDMQTIQGLQKGDPTEVVQQLRFLERLIEFVQLPSQIDKDVDVHYKEDMSLMHATLAPKVKAIFATEMELLPGDMRFEPEEIIPGLEELQAQQLSLTSQLQALTRNLHEASKGRELPQAITETQLKITQERIQAFKQQCIEFNRIYDTEIKTWLRDDHERLPAVMLGADVARINMLHENLDALLRNFRSIKDAFGGLLANDTRALTQYEEEHIFLRDDCARDLENSARILQSTLERCERRTTHESVCS